jgi:chromosome segregation protein
MHLKKIEAYGFKSFADKLCLEFNDGVTCIVGPNGCGKSNVSDAIRWVLGEQNAQELRTGKGNKMDQVIFKGTDNRRAMAYCEVSLVFDNTDRKLAVDADEVVITRKMYRTGESEYYINKQKDKLKNLINILRDTGIGKDGYSVIRQGKIETFLDAKPEDRRLIFEEAAGISKYKANRKEALKSLESTKTDMNLVAERLHGYETRIEPLEIQAETAEKAADLKSRIKELDVNHFLFLTEHSEEQRKTLEEKLKTADATLEKAAREKDEATAQYEAVTKRRAELDEAHRVVYERMMKLTDSAGAKNGTQQRLKDAIKQAESFISEKQTEIDEKTKTVETDTATKKSYFLENQQVTHDYMETKAEEEKLEREYAEIDAELNEKRSKIEITNSLLLDSLGKAALISGDVAKLETERISLERSVAANKETLETKNAELSEVRKKLKAEDENIEAIEKDRAEKKAAKKEYEEQYNKKFAARKEAEDRLAEIRDTITQKKTWIKYQEDGKQNFNGYDSAVKFLMTCGDPSVKSKICGVLGDLINVAPKYALAVETALGNSIGNMITRNQQDTSYLIDYLVRFSGGRGTFLPLTEMRPRPLESIYDDALEEDGCFGIAADLVKIDREYRSAVENLLGRVVVVQDKSTAVKMVAKYRNSFRIVTLTGENYAVNGAVTGGKTRSNNHILSIDAEIAEYKKQVEEFERAYKLLTDELDSTDREMKEIEKTNSVLDGILVKLDRDISAAEQRKQYSVLDQAKLLSETEKLAETIKNDQNEANARAVLLDTEKTKIGNQTSERSNANDLLLQMNEEVQALEKSRQDANIKRTEVITKVKTLEGRGKELAAGIAALEKNTDRMNAEILNATAQINIRNAEKERNRTELERLILENTDNEQLQAEKAKRDGIEKERAELEGKQETLYTATQECAEKLNIATEQKARAETMLENLRKETGAAREKVKEDYDLDYESALELRCEDYADADGVNEAKNLRKELAKLGEVNEMAIADLAALKEEYDTAKLHYDDIVKACEMLNGTISDLTKEMETKFSECFENVKANFSVVFSELFDGGKGRLALDTEFGQSVLDAGIIIEAEPPGKKLQNLDLLSGGERTLTAIAVIFAIIRLNPVPFCILDEVDAPLDDTNAVIYAKFLRKFSKKTQFIIVSHRKPTIELANVLYGITMQEKGVSKVFSVKLSEALDIAKKVAEGN